MAYQLVFNAGSGEFFNEDFILPEPIPATQSKLLTYSGDKRLEVENGGFELGPMHIATDDRSKTLITGARIKADGDVDFTTPWKTPDGNFTRIDAATIIAISDAVLNHVAACFDKEEVVAGSILNGTITAFKQIDDAWIG